MVTLRAWFWWVAQYPVYWVAPETRLWWWVMTRYLGAAGAYILLGRSGNRSPQSSASPSVIERKVVKIVPNECNSVMIWTKGDFGVNELRAACFRIGDLVSINLKTGEIEYGPTYTPDTAAKQFWDAVTRNMPVK